MPETYGKRQREKIKARKASAREERRIARAQRREARAARGKDAPSDDTWLGEANPQGLEDLPPADHEE